MTLLKSNNFVIDLRHQNYGLIYMPPGKRCEIVFSLSHEKNDWAHLVKAVSDIRVAKLEEGIYGSWKIVKDSLRGVFFVEFRGVRVFIGLDELNELLRLVTNITFKEK